MSRTEVANLRINEGKSNDPDGVVAEHNENEAEVQNSELTILQKHSLQEIRASVVGKLSLVQNFMTIVNVFISVTSVAMTNEGKEGHKFKSCWLIIDLLESHNFNK